MNKASPIDFETQISLRTKAPPKISLSKRAFEKYKPEGLLSEFYGMTGKWRKGRRRRIAEQFWGVAIHDD